MKRAERIGKRIARIRKERGLTQEGLIERLDESVMSLATLKRIETGNSPVKAIQIIAICNSLDCKVSDILPDDNMRDMIEEFNKDYTDSDTIRDFLNIQKLFYPEVPDNIKYQRFHIFNMLQFIIYLPLMDKVKLKDCLNRICGKGFGYEYYILEQLDYLYRSIPDSDAKKIADLCAEECTYNNFVEFHTKGETELDRRYTIEQEMDLIQAYMDVLEAL